MHSALTLILGLLAISFPFISGRKRQCIVDKISLQKDFNLQRYQGLWYSITANQLEVAFVSSILSDVKVNYTVLPDGNVQIKTGAQMFGWWCKRYRGVGVIENSAEPQKLTTTFNNWWTPLSGARPYWILSTDYTGYAIIYSCTKISSDGTCEPDSTYVYTLNRQPQPQSRRQLKKIKKALKRVCMDYSKFQKIPIYGGCDVL